MSLVTCNQLNLAIQGAIRDLHNKRLWIQNGTLRLQQGDGTQVQADLVPGLGRLLDELLVCDVWAYDWGLDVNERHHTPGETLATCQSLYAVWSQLSDRIDDLPVDVYVNGLHSYNPGTKTLTLNMSDNTVVDIPLSDLFSDVEGSLQARLRDCDGYELQEDTRVATCLHMQNALSALQQNLEQQLSAANFQAALKNKDGGALTGGTKVYSKEQVDANTQPKLRDADGNPIPANTQVPTVADMESAILNDPARGSLVGSQMAVNQLTADAVGKLVVYTTGRDVTLPPLADVPDGAVIKLYGHFNVSAPNHEIRASAGDKIYIALSNARDSIDFSLRDYVEMTAVKPLFGAPEGQGWIPIGVFPGTQHSADRHDTGVKYFADGLRMLWGTTPAIDPDSTTAVSVDFGPYFGNMFYTCQVTTVELNATAPYSGTVAKLLTSDQNGAEIAIEKIGAGPAGAGIKVNWMALGW